MDCLPSETRIRSRSGPGKVVDRVAYPKIPGGILENPAPVIGKTVQSPQRLRLALRGQIQGVGFRPFVFGLARSLGLTGFVFNDSRGLTIEVQGPKDALLDFTSQLELKKPPISLIDSLRRKKIPACPEESDFLIQNSPEESENLRKSRFDSLLPDTAICPDCLSELFDPKNRRYRYPLISCTNCGPRFSIAIKAPFDRCRTTLEGFPLCRHCKNDFNDPGNRRFHAQTIGCPICGPETRFLDGDGNPASGGDPVEKTLQTLLNGGVVTIKGIGGYHLAADARNREAVARIRTLKNRPNKPLAVMTGDLFAASILAHTGTLAKTALLSPERPIVLFPIQKGGNLPYDLIVPSLDRIGIFLPYTPIQHLLFGKESFSLTAQESKPPPGAGDDQRQP